MNRLDFSNINKDSDPRLPWHDVAVKLTGLVLRDIVKHFLERWNFANSKKELSKSKMHDVESILEPGKQVYQRPFEV